MAGTLVIRTAQLGSVSLETVGIMISAFRPSAITVYNYIERDIIVSLQKRKLITRTNAF